MSSKITIHHDFIILDACVLMNLYASGQIENILSAITERFTVAVYVIEFEALAVYKKSKTETPYDREPIYLQPLIDEGLLLVVDLESDAEKEYLIEFSAQRLDDGEAATMAIANNRNWALATDDRRAIRVLSSNHRNIQIVSTPDLIKHWQECAKPEIDVLYQTIIDIETRANYLVGKSHPLYEWWQNCKRN